MAPKKKPTKRSKPKLPPQEMEQKENKANRRSPRIAEQSPSSRTPLVEQSLNPRRSPRLDQPSKRRTKSVNSFNYTPLSFQMKNLTLKKKSSVYRTPFISSRRKPLRSPSNKEKIPTAVRDQWDETSRRVTSRTWRYCYLSSLVNYSLSDERFVSLFEKTLEKKVRDNFASLELKVSIKGSSFINRNIKHVDSVVFTIDSLKPTSEDEDDIWIAVYEAILVRSDIVQSVDIEETEWWPLLLYNGRELIHSSFVNWMQGMFGCYILPRNTSLTTVLWMAGIWTNERCQSSKYKHEKAEVEFLYELQLPSGQKFDSSIELSTNKPYTVQLKIHMEDMVIIWNQIKPNKTAELTREQLEEFHECINSICEKITAFPTSMLQLKKFHSSCVQVTTTGTIRFVCKHSMAVIISQLVQIFQQTCDFARDDEEEEDSS